MNLNTSQASSGSLGIALGLPGTAKFAPGEANLVRLSFQTAPTSFGSYAIRFTDGPVLREISDNAANALPAVYVDGTLTVEPLPELKIVKSGANIILSWPGWATNYSLQQGAADSEASIRWGGLTITNQTTAGENTLVLPIDPEARFYRLYRQ
jgi:hypothetical protein